MKFEKYLGIIDQRADLFYGVSDALWDEAELPYGEYKAVDMITGILEKEGFTVERNVANIPTCFTATYGTKGPHMGILAEYDALSGMSQEAHCPEQKSIPGKDTCHGCGHNLFAGGSLAAALAVKAYIEDGHDGIVTLFGCPAEEGGSGKVFMARAGVFKGIDTVISWHPERMYMVRTRPSLANKSILFSFEGIASHAGGSPEKGRSALDAVELMNVGSNFLREHMPLTNRLHYAIIDAGGTAPNMVQSHAKVMYTIRSVDNEGLQELKERVERIAQGAALMTDTKVSWKTVSAYSNLITIPTLQQVGTEAMKDLVMPIPTAEDLEYGRKLQESMILTKEQKAEGPFAAYVRDPAPPVPHGGSTDTADVSWNTPTLQFHIGNWVVGTPGHSWQAVSQCKSPYAKRAMLFGGQAVAGTIIRMLDNPELIAQAKAEHAAKVGDGYVCPLPDDVEPAIRPRPEN